MDTPQLKNNATLLIHSILKDLCPVGRMIMLRAVTQEYTEVSSDLGGFAEALENGEALGLFSRHGEGLLRKI